MLHYKSITHILYSIWSLSTTTVLRTPQRRRVRITYLLPVPRYPENRRDGYVIDVLRSADRSSVCVCVLVAVFVGPCYRLPANENETDNKNSESDG